MNKIYYPDRKTWESLCKRPSLDRSGLEESVAAILLQVKSSGDKAIIEFSEKYDGVVLENLRVSVSEITESATKVPAALREAIDVAKANIEKFHRSQLK